MIRSLQQLICPLDGGLLELTERSWRCQQGHSFDIARQGYVNLLPVQNKRSKDPGDSKLMVQARRRFLEQGYYQPLADALTETVLATGDQSLLDAGCGEGYYLAKLINAAESKAVSLSVAALDISKWAVQVAAKQDRRPDWIVASNGSIPLADQSLDTLICVFGFPVVDEFKRVLKPGGRLIMVDPGTTHLQELKALIYADQKQKTEVLPINDTEFQLYSEQRVSFPVSLSSAQDISDLLTMTPHLYRSQAKGREQVMQRTALELTADAWIRVFTR
ncbi:methyltransferase domain-containing protein [Idiomarina seosinensis]|uniref:putative RNA methyltransferase n=1 Tax=Idiomarina seosinensis TaxID=281739 RepID=UPI00384A84C0